MGQIALNSGIFPSFEMPVKMWGLDLTDHDFQEYPFHSGQFRFDLPKMRGYWEAVLDAFNLRAQ